jgi:hypothetical protein
MGEFFVQNGTGLPIDKSAPDAYRFYRCPKCGAMWDPKAFAAKDTK